MFITIDLHCTNRKSITRRWARSIIRLLVQKPKTGCGLAPWDWKPLLELETTACMETLVPEPYRDPLDDDEDDLEPLDLRDLNEDDFLDLDDQEFLEGLWDTEPALLPEPLEPGPVDEDIQDLLHQLTQLELAPVMNEPIYEPEVPESYDSAPPPTVNPDIFLRDEIPMGGALADTLEQEQAASLKYDQKFRQEQDSVLAPNPRSKSGCSHPEDLLLSTRR